MNKLRVINALVDARDFFLGQKQFSIAEQFNEALSEMTAPERPSGKIVELVGNMKRTAGMFIGRQELDAMAAAYEDERAKYWGNKVYYPNNHAAFIGAMSKAIAASKCFQETK